MKVSDRIGLSADKPRKLSFSEYCEKCDKVVPFEVQTNASRQLWVVCPSCGLKHEMRNRCEIYHKQTDLWVTKFTFGNNLQGVVAARLSKV